MSEPNPIQDPRERITALEHALTDARQEIETLRANKQWYQRIINLAHEGILLLDPDQRIADLNRKALNLLGCEPAQVMGNRMDSLYERSSVEFFSASRHHLSFEAQIPTQDGKRTPILFNRSTITGDDGTVEGYTVFLIQLTELKLAQNQKRMAELRYREMYQNAVQGMFRSTVSGRMLNVNPAYARILGYGSPDEILALKGATNPFYFDPDDRTRMIARLQKDQVLTNYEIRLKRKDGEPVWALANIRLVASERGEALLEGIIVDNTEKKIAEERLKKSEEKFRLLAIRDSLTGLYNTRHLYAALDELIAQVDNAGMRFSLIFMDMDNFKTVVDTHGHLNGSRALQQVAQTIRECLSPPCFGVAYGGDEFVAVLPGFDGDQAREKAEQIQARMHRTTYLEKEGCLVRLGASFGVATCPDDARDRTGLLALADQAMFHVKKTGKNAVATSQTAVQGASTE